jgi:ketosteroid isomerase-like protein
MSEERVGLVRKPLRVPERGRRTLFEQLVMRFPRFGMRLGDWVSRLPVRSRLRQALVWWKVRIGLASYNRRDWESLATSYHPQCEAYLPPELQAMGLDRVYRGRERVLDLHKRWADEWGDWKVRPEELLDLGDELLVLGEIDLRGARSGVEFGGSYGLLWTLERGAIKREEHYMDQHQALEAAGLSE